MLKIIINFHFQRLHNSTVAENDEKISKNTKPTLMSEQILKRQKTWHMDLDIDSGTNSPLSMFKSSTPVEQMSDSIEKLSVTSEEEKLGPGDFVLKAYVYLDKAICIMSNNRRNAITEPTDVVNSNLFSNIYFLELI